MAAQYGPHRWSAGLSRRRHNDALRGASFTVADLAGAKFVDCDMSQVKIIDSWLVDVNVSGYVSNFVVNDVDVTAFVDAELDRRHPERVQLRQMQTADDYRAMWDTIERLWSDTVARADRLPEPLSTNGSTASGLRRDAAPSGLHHRRLGESHGPRRAAALPPARRHPNRLCARGRGGARHRSRRASVVRRGDGGTRRPHGLVRGIVDGLTNTELERICTRAPAPGYPEESRSVGDCLGVVMQEECEHLRYAVRDLAVLQAS